MNIIIVGGGHVGYFLARRLARSHYVTLVEKDPETARLISQDTGFLAITGDGCAPNVLVQAGIRNADVIAAVTGSDEDNLVVCQIAKDVFKLGRTVARVNDSANEKIFVQLGVDIAIDSTAIIAKIVEEEVSLEDMITLFAFKKGRLALLRIDLPETSPVVGAAVRDLTIPKDAVIVAVLRKDEILLPKGDFVFAEGDEVVALTKVENEREVFTAFMGAIS